MRRDTIVNFYHQIHSVEKYLKGLKNRISLAGKMKQAGTGPSRRHIQGSKIAKRLPSVKYSFTVVENRKFSF